MAHGITLAAPNREAMAQAQEALRQALPEPERIAQLDPGLAEDWIFRANTLPALAQLRGILEPLPVDYAVQPTARRQKRLLLADMDSTIISCECLDELADFAGKKAQIAEITEAAMRGELEFEAALRARVQLLAGLASAALAECFEQRVQLNPGAQCLIATMAASGARCVLVSGGFSYFTQRVMALAGFNAEFSNTLIIRNEVLTGEVEEPILGREAKAARLMQECAALAIDPAQAMAIGDGANDSAMIAQAGLGVAYHAKPVLNAVANARILYTDLTAALYFQGYPRTRHVQPPPRRD